MSSPHAPFVGIVGVQQDVVTIYTWITRFGLDNMYQCLPAGVPCNISTSKKVTGEVRSEVDHQGLQGLAILRSNFIL